MLSTLLFSEIPYVCTDADVHVLAYESNNLVVSASSSTAIDPLRALLNGGFQVFRFDEANWQAGRENMGTYIDFEVIGAENNEVTLMSIEFIVKYGDKFVFKTSEDKKTWNTERSLVCSRNPISRLTHQSII